jgi:pimeloyl-ACP methyl ester carboxylesterase
MFSQSPPLGAREALITIMRGFHPLGFRLMATSSAAADTRDLLPKIRVPTLLIWGGADARSPLTVAQQFLHAVPGASLTIIPGAGHVSNLEAPAEFTAAVRDFCLHCALTPSTSTRAASKPRKAGTTGA